MKTNFPMELVMPGLSSDPGHRIPFLVEPSYIQTLMDNDLPRKVDRAKSLLESCTLCPRNCGTNRLLEPGKICHLGRQALVSSYFPHFGEEKCITGSRGSGTIFFTSCNLRCVFCQNWDISHAEYGRPVTVAELAAMMLELQSLGCHNINLVTPSHVVPSIVEAVAVASEQGLSLPIVYNTSGYDGEDTLELLDGIVDIYMPDVKFWSVDSARSYLKAADYPEVVRHNLHIMHSQVGDLTIDARGIATRGLLVRHLVMPGHPEDTQKILTFLADRISPVTAVNLMFQYRPEYKVRRDRYPDINRVVSSQERQEALDWLHQSGLRPVPD